MNTQKKDLTIASPSNAYLEEFQSQVLSAKQRALGKESPSNREQAKTAAHPDKDFQKSTEDTDIVLSYGTIHGH